VVGVFGGSGYVRDCFAGGEGKVVGEQYNARAVVSVDGQG